MSGKEIIRSGNEYFDERFLFRTIDPDDQEEGEYAVYVEQICFPPNEACTREEILDRISAAPEVFLLAIDRETGKIAGYLNGIATNEKDFRDEFFSEASTLHDPDGSTVMLLGLDVMPEYRLKGLARELVRIYSQREKARGRKRLLLTCVEDKIDMYKKFGFKYMGVSASVYGGVVWYDMDIMLD